MEAVSDTIGKQCLTPSAQVEVTYSPYAPERKRSSNDANERESSLEK
jgi:hypothetical protein